MPELLRSFVARMRGYVADRRRAPRYQLRLPCRVSLYDAGARAPRPAPELEGYTRDISASGLALVLPAVRVGGRYLTGADVTLRVVLARPEAPIELLAAPVHYDQLSAEGDGEQGFLVGVKIKTWSAADRARYEAQLNELRS